MAFASSCSRAARIALRDALIRSATISTAIHLHALFLFRCCLFGRVASVLLDRFGHRPDVLKLAVVSDAVGAADNVAAALSDHFDAILDLALDLLGGSERERVVEVDIADDADL